MSNEKKIESLIKQMTLEEKVSLCSGADNWHTRPIERLGIPAIRMTDGPHGCRTEKEGGTRETIPATCFPTASALAATWDEDLTRRIGAALAEETKARKNHVLLGPAINIQRTPLGGRNFEYMSEDPYLTARLAVAYIKGLQSKGVACSVKHFACNNQEFERMTISAEVDERALQELYWPAFRAAVVEAEAWTVMSSYNRINGVSSAHNKRMLTDLLKGEWGFDGFVVSDWGGVYDRLAAANAGLDVEMPNHGDMQMQELLAAVKSGKVSESAIDDKVRRLLRIIFRTGAFEGAQPELPLLPAESQRLAAEAAREAMVLLKNKSDVLPLDEAEVKTIGLIGPAASIPLIEGGGSSRVKPWMAVTALDGLKQRCGNKVKLTYEPGCSIDGALPALATTHLTAVGGQTHGWLAEFFGNPRLQGNPVATRVEKTIALDKDGLPADLAGADFSVRWSAGLTSPTGGACAFSLAGSGRSRVLVDGQVVVSRWQPPAPAPFTPDLSVTTGRATLTAGTAHTLSVEFSRNDEAKFDIQLGCQMPGDDAMERAVKLAAASDVAVVVAGLPDRYESEGYDRPDMELTGDQVTLIKRVAAANKRTVVVLLNGSPVNMSPWIGRVSAVLEAWYAGQDSGNAIAAILFGDANPSGKLPTTFPKCLEDSPSYVNYPGENDRVMYGEGIFVGYRYYDKVGLAPLFPFGHGLSYTTFAYGKLVAPRRVKAGESFEVKVDVTNAGKREGKEVVQLYVHDVESRLPRPPRELKGFHKVALKSGETKTVSFTLTPADLAFYDPARKAWVTEPGAFEILVGSSSRDIRAKTAVAVASESPGPLFTGDSRLGEILRHRQGRAVLRRHLGDPKLMPRLEWVSSYTLDQLAYFQPSPFTRELVQKIKGDLKLIK